MRTVFERTRGVNILPFYSARPIYGGINDIIKAMHDAVSCTARRRAMTTRRSATPRHSRMGGKGRGRAIGRSPPPQFVVALVVVSATYTHRSKARKSMYTRKRVGEHVCTCAVADTSGRVDLEGLNHPLRKCLY